MAVRGPLEMPRRAVYFESAPAARLEAVFEALRRPADVQMVSCLFARTP